MEAFSSVDDGGLIRSSMFVLTLTVIINHLLIKLLITYEFISISINREMLEKERVHLMLMGMTRIIWRNSLCRYMNLLITL